MQIFAYTDGSSRGNPGRGGYGVVLLAPEIKLKKEFSMGFKKTTNNRMELLAAIVALEKLKNKQDIVIITDSKYVCDAVNKKWVFSWEKKQFSGKKNPDLWMRFLRNYRKHNVTLSWVKGHAGHQWNELADKLATEAADGKNLKVDLGFERSIKKDSLF